MALRKQILFFAISGVIGFVVDAGIVQFLVSRVGRESIRGAPASRFLAAATTTWRFNRKFTFAGHSGGSRRRQLIRYIVAMAGGFALQLRRVRGLRRDLFRSCANGRRSASRPVRSPARCVNFLTSKYWIFRAPKGQSAGSGTARFRNALAIVAESGAKSRQKSGKSGHFPGPDMVSFRIPFAGPKRPL